MSKNVDLLILGSGPAGNTAAIYAGRAGLKPTVLAGIISAGGALMNTSDIENFPGFPGGIAGSELIDKQQEQAKNFGAVYEYDEASEVELNPGAHLVRTELGEEYIAKALIVASGSLYRQIGCPGETEFAGRGVSYCATCDGFFFKGKDLIVVGGGDTAMEEAIYLANLASSVTLIHRRDEFRASQIMLNRAKEHAKIKFMTPYTIEQISGNASVEEVALKNTKTGEQKSLGAAGVFVAIGSVPQTKFLGESLELDSAGFIKLEGRSSKTSVEGVFAAGDATDPDYRQAIVAAGAGAKAAIDAEKYLA